MMRFANPPAIHTPTRRSCLFAAAVLMMALHANAADPAADGSPSVRVRDKVVFQVSDADPKKWTLALNNAKNIQAALGRDNVDIEIVAYGPGIGILKGDSEAKAKVEEAQSAGVKLVACENTMASQKLVKTEMLPGISYAPAGVVEIMRRQQEGYAYIKP